MAHECPDCSLPCHCGGDIDDLVFNDTKYELLCGHCDGDEGDEYEFEDDHD